MNRRSLIGALTGGAAATSTKASSFQPSTPIDPAKLRLLELAQQIASNRNGVTLYLA